MTNTKFVINCIPFCFRQLSVLRIVLLLIGEGLSDSIYPSSICSIREFKSSNWKTYYLMTQYSVCCIMIVIGTRKKCCSSTLYFRSSFSSYCKAPSKTSCITSGNIAPLHKSKNCRSNIRLLLFTLYNFDDWPDGSLSTSCKCCLCWAKVRSSKASSWNYKTVIVIKCTLT